jgi:hypothetical protein
MDASSRSPIPRDVLDDRRCGAAAYLLAGLLLLAAGSLLRGVSRELEV